MQMFEHLLKRLRELSENEHKIEDCFSQQLLWQSVSCFLS